MRRSMRLSYICVRQRPCMQLVRSCTWAMKDAKHAKCVAEHCAATDDAQDIIHIQQQPQLSSCLRLNRHTLVNRSGLDSRGH
jgi:hypothetical protein